MPGTATAAGCRGWKLVPSPNLGTSTPLYGVAVVPRSSSAWAVGIASGTTGHPITSPEILRWTGTRWRQVPGPEANLFAVTAVSRSDAWAVGENGILHWNGTAWTSSPATVNGILYGVAATSRRNAWAVGGANLVHWNGTTWQQQWQATPNADLRAVAAVSARDAWAVGYSAGTNGSTGASLILHWNGTRWKQVPSPNPRNPAHYANFLTGVAATSATSAWAVGSYQFETTEQDTLDPIIEHWNGTRWKLVRSPDPSPGNTWLKGVTATSATNAWAVGGSSATFNQTLVEHWNGKTWHRVVSPKLSRHGETLQAVAASSTRRFVWAVGVRDNGFGGTLTLYHC